MRTDVILMILTLLMTELTVIGRKENVKGKSNQGLNAFAFCDLLYYFLNPKILLKIFFTTFSFFCGFTTGSYLREPCLSPFF